MALLKGAPTTTTETALLPNIGAGLTGVEFSSVVWGNYDNDGGLDILGDAAAAAGSAYFYLARGMNGVGVRSAASNRVGAVGFSLTPGTR